MVVQLRSSKRLETNKNSDSFLGTIDDERVIFTLQNPSKWSCQYKFCETTMALWICLTCGKCLCMKELEKNPRTRRPKETHVQLHHLKSATKKRSRRQQHSLFMELNTTAHRVYCCESNEYIEHDNARGSLALLRTVLSQVQNITLDEPTKPDTPTTRSASKLLSSSSSSPVAILPPPSSAKPAVSRWKTMGVAVRLAYFRPQVIKQRLEEDAMYTANFKYKYTLAAKSFNSWKMYIEMSRSLPDTPCSTPRQRRIFALYPGSTGLRNLGNTCYMNAVLQVLSHAPPLRDFIRRQNEQNKDLSDKTLLLQLHGIFERLNSSKRAAFSPDIILSVLWDLFPSMSGFKQQDSDELLRNMLFQLEKEEGDLSKSLDIRKTCGGELHTTVICDGCQSESVSKETFLGILSVEIPQHHQVLKQQSSRNPSTSQRQQCLLQECLDQTTTKEKLNGDCQYYCSKCQKLEDAVKYTCIGKFPDTLILHINRASWTNGFRKIHTNVKFPLNDLDLSQYAAGTVVPGGKTTYMLRSVVVHKGRSMTEGHYTTFGWNEWNQSWLHFNDHRVVKVSADKVASQQAYLLAYFKTGH